MIAIVVSVASIAYAALDSGNGGEDTKFIVYIGLDPDCTQAEKDDLESWATGTLLSDYRYGYTCHWASGGYIAGDTAVSGDSTTLVMIITYSEEDRILDFVHRTAERYGCAVMVEKQTVDAELILPS